MVSFNLCAEDAANIRSVNFLQDGEVSKLIIDLDRDILVEKNQIKEDKQIILDLKNVTASKKMLRGIDTSEFSGSAVFVSPYKKPGSKNDIRFAIQLRDNVRSFVEKRKNRIILHLENRFGVFTRSKLKKASEQSNVVSNSKKEKVLIPKSSSLTDILENLTQSGVKRYVGRKISINVSKIPYEQVIKMISDTSGFNIIIEDDVNQLSPLSISLTNLPWDQVLDTIMDLGELVALKHGNILTIKTALSARAERQKELDEQTANKVLEPLVTKIFPISYAGVNDISAILADYSTEGRGSLKEDARTTSIIVKDTVEVIERMKKIIAVLDTQTPQILIEAKIVEANESYEFRAGLAGNGIQFSYDPFSKTSDLNSDSGTFTLSSITSQKTSLVNASVSVFKRLSNLNFALDLMESESKGRIISSPKIITENNKAATISNTNSQNFRTSTSTDSGITTEITPISASVSLNVTPKVTNEGSINLQVSVSKSGFGAQEDANSLPATTSRTLNTNVLVDNGSTVVLGGIYQTEDSEISTGIPFLKDLPLVGWLFKSAYNPKKIRNELIIFITPRIINQEKAGLVNREMSDLGI
jgi:type IV pilus assembly protein PilQ